MGQGTETVVLQFIDEAGIVERSSALDWISGSERVQSYFSLSDRQCLSEVLRHPCPPVPAPPLGTSADIAVAAPVSLCCLLSPIREISKERLSDGAPNCFNVRIPLSMLIAGTLCSGVSDGAGCRLQRGIQAIGETECPGALSRFACVRALTSRLRNESIVCYKEAP